MSDVIARFSISLAKLEIPSNLDKLAKGTPAQTRGKPTDPQIYLEANPLQELRPEAHLPKV